MGNAKILESFKRHPDWSDRRRANALYCTVAEIRANRPNSVEEKPVRKNLTDFRQQYDKNFIIPARIDAALKKLGAGGWETELNFARLANVSMTDINLFREQYDEHVVLVDRGSKRIWAGSKKLAAKLREMV